eukprot:10225816-Ditylum_brightwellii.AAC.1
MQEGEKKKKVKEEKTRGTSVGKNKKEQAGGSESKKKAEVYADGISRPAFINVGSSKTKFEP